MTDTLSVQIPPEKRMAYVLGGNCTFTVMSHRTGHHITYKIKSAKKDRNLQWSTNNMDLTRFFVSVLTGPDNTEDYEYICSIDARPNTPIVSARGVESKHVKNFRWLFKRLLSRNPYDFGFLPSTQCGRCGRKLTTPESVSNGFGPECAGKG